MEVYIEKTNEFREVAADSVKGLLSELNINPTTVIVIKNNELVTESEEIKENDSIKILSVISGG